MKRKIKITFFAILIVLILFVVTFSKRKNQMEDETEYVHILISLNGDNGNKAIFERYISKFNTSNPLIQVEPHYVISDLEAMLKLIYAQHANQKYDIVCMGANQRKALGKQQFIVPLDQYIIDNLGVTWLENLLPISMTNTFSDGQIWSIPFLQNARVVFFNRNKENFQSQYITLEDILNLAETEKIKQSFLLAPIQKILLEYITYQIDDGSNTTKSSTISIDIANGNKIDIMRRVQENVSERNIQYYSENSTRGMEGFFNGQFSAIISNTAYSDTIINSVNFPVNMSVLKIDDNTTFPLQTSNLYLVKQTKESNYSRAWKVIQSLWEISTSKEDLYHKDHLPITEEQSVKCKWYMQVEKNKCWGLLVNTYNGYSSMIYSQNAKINLLLETMLNEIINQEAEPAKALTELQMQLETLYDS